jgi:hypothetical protein
MVQSPEPYSRGAVSDCMQQALYQHSVPSPRARMQLAVSRSLQIRFSRSHYMPPKPTDAMVQSPEPYSRGAVSDCMQQAPQYSSLRAADPFKIRRSGSSGIGARGPSVSIPSALTRWFSHPSLIPEALSRAACGRWCHVTSSQSTPRACNLPSPGACGFSSHSPTTCPRGQQAR